ncbi:XRE family transcriptional regulator (plasmid) [Flammeovirga pectinis]|uniref:XRE family transcriptional regulator n=1 Tax=Flammeovirga pectinis TaxID=2494373 RepID=A0A3Q9FST4_9BACT|nr:helix-turn-helix transcriptional regulator [Flammeovirga pectinis]AZQ65629.1 XRE family transcriptional regulator [Flammeovirga pectinis]
MVRSNTQILIKQIRLEKKMTQHQLADFCDLPRSYISKLEGGTTHPTLEMLFRVCKGLEIKPSSFVKRLEEF